MSNEVGSSTSCQKCCQNENIFKGEIARDDFCRWLFSETNRGAKVLCHNFKGYDSYPILQYLYQNGVLPEKLPGYDSIGIIPPNGYRPQQKQSIKAKQWLQYILERHGINIMHAINGGEKQIGPFLVDGYHETVDGERIIYEFHGCFYFWGKFGQRLTTYLTDPAIYFNIITSDSQEVQDVSFVTDDMVRINWINQSQFIEETGRTNVVIAAYTTTQARLELYSYLENFGERALYCDTDSIIFSSKPGDWIPDTGDYLGDLTDEAPNNSIECFITGGPKNYSYKLKNPDKDGNLTCCKIRGITLNYKNSLELNYETMKDVVEGKTKKTTANDYNKICHQVKTTNIITRAEDKTYKIVFSKRVLKNDFTTTPYGM
ncbi:unnamed protein product [Mytilus edulis]|uniref:DNA-directed DNA polymerase n=1 Tax=Mytilus edulis TaxID=6550 RepID=A0A8S3UG56_MYTED|nr:unnamed protein product [Mytilus edulis]